MQQKIVTIKPLGNVLLKKTKRAKYISIKLKPNKGIVVTLPPFVPYSDAINFVKSRKEWVIQHLPKIKEIEKNFTVFDENTFFKTRDRKLTVQKEDIENAEYLINKKNIIVKYPADEDVKSEYVQKAIKIAIGEALRIEAKNYLPQRVEYFAKKFGFNYNKLFFKNIKTRWGSCSNKNNINLNVHLLRLPNRFIDYVILHELIHTIHKNHSKQFWNHLEKVLPGSKILDKELNNYSIHKIESYEE